MNRSLPACVAAVLPALLLPSLLATAHGDEPPAQQTAQQTAKQPAPQTVIRIAKETTRLTEPLDDAGFLDYVAAMNARFARGVTPETNYEVVVRRVAGHGEIGEWNRAEYYARLGIAAPPENAPEDGRYYVDFPTFVAGTRADGTEEGSNENSIENSEEAHDEWEELMQGPWRAADHPRGVRWLERVTEPLDRLVEGSKRPHNYMPYLAGEFDPAEPMPRMIAVLLPSPQQQRSLTRGLRARAMHRLATGDLDAAWSDLQAIHRIGRHLSRGWTLIELLVAMSVDAGACEAEALVLNAPGLTDAQAKRFLADLRDLPPLPSMVPFVDEGERYMALDTMQTLARAGAANLPAMLDLITQLADSETPFATTFVADDPPAVAPPAAPFQPDWNESMLVLNEWYDRIVAAARHEDPARRRAAFEEVDTALKQLKVDSQNPGKLLLRHLIGGDTPKVVGRGIGQILAMLLVPSVSSVHVAENRATARRDLLVVAFAAEVHRREHGRYPARLDDLVPGILPAVPVDPFTHAPLRVRTTATEFRVYSVGDNLVDDAGRTRDESDAERDDIAVGIARDRDGR